MQVGNALCNPIMQAKLLEKAGTDFNVVVGLCVGHDSLFYKYTHTLTTTLVDKRPRACTQSGWSIVSDKSVLQETDG